MFTGIVEEIGVLIGRKDRSNSCTLTIGCKKVLENTKIGDSICLLYTSSYRTKWKDFYQQGGIVIADRYTTSNMVHQMTKFDDEQERAQFLEWLEKTEYTELELPKPDCVILLDVPLTVSEKLVKERAVRGGSMDIHEQHIDYLRRCHAAYQILCQKYGWRRVECCLLYTSRCV